MTEELKGLLLPLRGRKKAGEMSYTNAWALHHLVTNRPFLEACSAESTCTVQSRAAVETELCPWVTAPSTGRTALRDLPMVPRSPGAAGVTLAVLVCVPQRA